MPNAPTKAFDDPLSEMFAGLAHPARRAILARLSQGEATVNELAAPFALSLPAVSKHIKVLERAGLIRRGRRAQYRPCRIDPDGIAAIATWVEQYRAIWSTSLDRLETYLSQLDTHRPDTTGPTDD